MSASVIVFVLRELNKGLEPSTSCLQGKCTTNCANPAKIKLKYGGLEPPVYDSVMNPVYGLEIYFPFYLLPTPNAFNLRGLVTCSIGCVPDNGQNICNRLFAPNGTLISTSHPSVSHDTFLRCYCFAYARIIPKCRYDIIIYEICVVCRKKIKGWIVGLEPTISGTTIRHSNQLNYIHHSIINSVPGTIRTFDNWSVANQFIH